MYKSEKGFTLIELLVVIAIIAILAAILFPVFTQVKGKGKQAACLNHMRQLGMALMEYGQDNGGRYPPIPPHYTSNGDNWATRLLPYIKSPGVFRCAGDPRKPPEYYWGMRLYDYPYGADLNSYSYNAYLTDYYDKYPPGGTNGLLMAEVRWASKCIALHDTRWVGHGAQSVGFPMYSGVWTESYWGDPQKTHLGGFNITFADGHAMWYRYPVWIQGPRFDPKGRSW